MQYEDCSHFPRWKIGKACSYNGWKLSSMFYVTVHSYIVISKTNCTRSVIIYGTGGSIRQSGGIILDVRFVEGNLFYSPYISGQKSK